MSSPRSGRGRGLGAQFKRLFGRNRDTGHAATTDLPGHKDDRWESEDYVAAVTDDEPVFDPWDAAGNSIIPEVETATQAGAETIDNGKSVYGREPATFREHIDEVVEPDAIDHHPADHASPDEPPSDLQKASQAGDLDGEDWDLLKEAEQDFAKAGDENFAPQPLDEWVDEEIAETDGLERPESSRETQPYLPGILEDIADSSSTDSPSFGEYDEVGFESFFPDAGLDPNSEADFDVYDYDDEARQALWEPEPVAEETAVRRARKKAAAITALLDVSNTREQAHVLQWLTQFFERLHHPSTYRAIEAAAVNGLTPETLEAMVELRRTWLQRPAWWVGRYGPRREVSRLRNGPSALTWAEARRICRKRPDYSPELMIKDDWLDDWLALLPGDPGYLSFPAYIDVRLKGREASNLDLGLQLVFEDDGEAEFCNDWYRSGHGSGREQLIDFGFQYLTPYDERPGQLGGYRERADGGSDDDDG